MVKILSQAGQSLADIYDVEGSIAGIEQLQPGELPIVHEMGATVFSERFSTQILRVSSGDVLQSVNLGSTVPNMPDAIGRILGVCVLSDNSARVAHCNLLSRDPIAGQEFPVWIWDENTTAKSVRIIDDNQATAVFELLEGAGPASMIPNFMGGVGQPQTVDQLVMRGATTAFGAGTVEVIMLVMVAFSLVGGVSSRGLPIPSW